MTNYQKIAHFKQFSISLQTNTSNTANMDVILSPGKEYVYGYEY